MTTGDGPASIVGAMEGPVDSATVTDNPAAERYELRRGGELIGILEYRGGGEVRALTHTEILAGNEGQGLAGRLVGAVLDDLRERDLKILPVCPYVKHFLQEHREYVDLVEPRHRAGFGL